MLTRLLVALAVLVFAGTAQAQNTNGGLTTVGGSPAQSQGSQLALARSSITNIVFIDMENHSYDNYFCTYEIGVADTACHSTFSATISGGQMTLTTNAVGTVTIGDAVGSNISGGSSSDQVTFGTQITGLVSGTAGQAGAVYSLANNSQTISSAMAMVTSPCVPSKPSSGTVVYPTPGTFSGCGGEWNTSKVNPQDISHHTPDFADDFDPSGTGSCGGVVNTCALQDGFLYNALTGGTSSTPDTNFDVLGFYDSTNVPNYTAYANAFVLADHFFEPTGSWSLTSHIHMISGWTAYCPNYPSSTGCIEEVNPYGLAGGCCPTPAPNPQYAAFGYMPYILDTYRAASFNGSISTAGVLVTSSDTGVAPGQLIYGTSVPDTETVGTNISANHWNVTIAPGSNISTEAMSVGPGWKWYRATATATGSGTSLTSSQVGATGGAFKGQIPNTGTRLIITDTSVIDSYYGALAAGQVVAGTGITGSPTIVNQVSVVGVSVSNATWASNQTTYTVGTNLSSTLVAGDSIHVTGALPSGFSGEFVVVSVSSTQIVVTQNTNPGTYTSGGTVSAGGGIGGGSATVPGLYVLSSSQSATSVETITTDGGNAGGTQGGCTPNGKTVNYINCTAQSIIGDFPTGYWDVIQWFALFGNTCGQAGCTPPDTTYQNFHVNFVNQFFLDVTNGTLPQVSWIIPSESVSDHPSLDPKIPLDAERFVTEMVNTIANSPTYAGKTAIFIFWDDWGGYYDHVAPPRSQFYAQCGQATCGGATGILCNANGSLQTTDAGVLCNQQYGWGMRVPMLLINAYAKPGYLDAQYCSFDCFNLFTEQMFAGGQPIDGNASSPTYDGYADPRPHVSELISSVTNSTNGASIAVGSLLNDFNFSQTPTAIPILTPQ